MRLFNALLLLLPALAQAAPLVIENISHVPSDRMTVALRLTKPYAEPDPYVARGMKFRGDCLIINLNDVHRYYSGPYQVEVRFADKDGNTVMIRQPYAQRGQGYQLITDFAATGKVRFRRGTRREHCNLGEQRIVDPYQIQGR